MIVFIKSLQFEAIIGVLEFERIYPQEIEVDIEIEYEGDIVDYSVVRKNVINIIKTKKFKYLEDAIYFLKDELKELFPQILSLQICIKKLKIFNNCVAGVKEKFNFF